MHSSPILDCAHTSLIAAKNSLSSEQPQQSTSVPGAWSTSLPGSNLPQHLFSWAATKSESCLLRERSCIAGNGESRARHWPVRAEQPQQDVAGAGRRHREEQEGGNLYVAFRFSRTPSNIDIRILTSILYSQRAWSGKSARTVGWDIMGRN